MNDSVNHAFVHTSHIEHLPPIHTRSWRPICNAIGNISSSAPGRLAMVKHCTFPILETEYEQSTA